MNARPPKQQQKVDMLKIARAAIRLKHSLAADDEINEKLPKLEDKINRAFQRGEPFKLDVASLLRDAR